MSDESPREPEPSIVREWLVFAVICLVVGAVFVALRVAKDGPQVLTHAPHRR